MHIIEESYLQTFSHSLRRTPLKYLHMLQWAGYDFLVAADSMVDKDLNVLSTNSPLSDILVELECVTDTERFTQLWKNWNNGRK